MSRILRAVVRVVTASLVVSGGVVAVASPAVADSTKVVFDRGGHIWIMDGDGSNQTDLMTGWSGGSAYNPSLSPDGGTVAFVWQTGASSTEEIYTMPSTPTAQTSAVRLTDNSVLDADPAWSPDGTMLAFTRDVPSNGVPQNYEVFTMTSAGANVTRITTDGTGAYDTDPAWSPDGSTLAYTSGADGFGCFDEDVQIFIGFDQIHVVPATGGAGTNILNRPTLTAASPDWSPDGSSMAFYGDEYTLGPDTGNGPTCVSRVGNRIYTMPATGSSTPTPLHTGLWPSWSPDGTRLAFSEDPTQALTVMAADGTNVAVLGGAGRFVDWVSPSATTIATTTTVAVTLGTKLKASGDVQPNVAGQQVTVRLARKQNGTFVKVAARHPVLDGNSTYRVRFPHPAAGKCRVKTTYPGDATHLPSSDRVVTDC